MSAHTLPATGDLTFDPIDGFTTDPTPITYTLTDSATGLPLSSNMPPPRINLTQMVKKINKLQAFLGINTS